MFTKITFIFTIFYSFHVIAGDEWLCGNPGVLFDPDITAAEYCKLRSTDKYQDCLRDFRKIESMYMDGRCTPPILISNRRQNENGIHRKYDEKGKQISEASVSIKDPKVLSGYQEESTGQKKEIIYESRQGLKYSEDQINSLLGLKTNALPLNGVIREYQEKDVAACRDAVTGRPDFATKCDSLGNPITGIIKKYEEYEEFGKYIIADIYQNGKRLESRSINFFDDGSIKKIEGKKGVPDSKGKLVFMSHGPRKYYYENGKLRSEENYKDGKKDGIQKEYYQNGNLKEEKFYKDGIEDGSQKWYSENGKLTKEEVYENKMHTLTKNYDSDGFLKEEVSPAGYFVKKYKDGELMEGWIRLHDPMEQQCDSKADFYIPIYAIIEKEGNLKEIYNALFQSDLEKICPNRYYILQFGELSSSVISTLNEPGSLRIIEVAGQPQRKEVYAPEFSCVGHICAHEDICAGPNWQEQTTDRIEKHHYRIQKFTHSCFW